MRAPGGAVPAPESMRSNSVLPGSVPAAGTRRLESAGLPGDATDLGGHQNDEWQQQ